MNNCSLVFMDIIVWDKNPRMEIKKLELGKEQDSENRQQTLALDKDNTWSRTL